MVLPKQVKRFVSSIGRLQWVLVFLVALIPTVALIVYFVEYGTPEMEYKDGLEEMYGKVIYVNIMYRHGDRNTFKPPPNDPYSDLKYWPGGFGSLTPKGVLQQYKLGKWLAERYRHLLPSDWTTINDAIRVVSTDTERTIMSAEANLAGMFPITQNLEIWEGLTSYPVPIHILPADDDNIFELTKECKGYSALVRAVNASEKYQNIMRMYKNVSDYIEQNSGGVVVDLASYRGIYMNYYIEEGRGWPLPKWLGKVYPSPLRELSALSLATPTWTTEMKRLRGGMFVKEILGNFRGKLNGTLSLNVSMNSAHETSLAAAMGAMDIFNNETPPFTAVLLLELRMPKNDTEPAVMIWYKNSTSDPFLLSLPRCTGACPLSEVEQLLEPIIPDDWDKECQEIPSTGL